MLFDRGDLCRPLVVCGANFGRRSVEADSPTSGAVLPAIDTSAAVAAINKCASWRMGVHSLIGLAATPMRNMMLVSRSV